MAQMPLSSSVDPRLHDALRHILQNPGSLARPRIVVQTATAYGLSETHSEILAIALEYFHTASLVFDDLPCMDNAKQRRGAECVHLVFGEATAILAALALVNRGYALIWRTVATSPAGAQARALDYVERNLGMEGLLNGQSLDLNYAALPHDRQTTERIALGKTVSLIRLALVLPAIMGGANQAELASLERVAKYWGFAYQILDDLKDVLQGSHETGKTTDRDSALDRPNISLTIGIPAAILRLKRLIRTGDSALQRLLKLRPELAFLEALRNDLQSQAKRASQAASATAAQVSE